MRVRRPTTRDAFWVDDRLPDTAFEFCVASLVAVPIAAWVFVVGLGRRVLTGDLIPTPRRRDYP